MVIYDVVKILEVAAQDPLFRLWRTSFDISSHKHKKGSSHVVKGKKHDHEMCRKKQRGNINAYRLNMGGSNIPHIPRIPFVVGVVDETDLKHPFKLLNLFVGNIPSSISIF